MRGIVVLMHTAGRGLYLLDKHVPIAQHQPVRAPGDYQIARLCGHGHFERDFGLHTALVQALQCLMVDYALAHTRGVCALGAQIAAEQRKLGQSPHADSLRAHTFHPLPSDYKRARFLRQAMGHFAR